MVLRISAKQEERRDSLVDLATNYKLYSRGSIPGRANSFFPSSDQTWGQSTL
jgi:hypothetical protein